MQQKRLLKKEVFAILYVDLDNFKAYNDIYGFSSGDEIIKFTDSPKYAELLQEISLMESFRKSMMTREL